MRLRRAWNAPQGRGPAPRAFGFVLVVVVVAAMRPPWVLARAAKAAACSTTSRRSTTRHDQRVRTWRRRLGRAAGLSPAFTSKPAKVLRKSGEAPSATATARSTARQLGLSV